ncbi:hypothetical protein JCM10207_003323, partial [Rhodosporidiobolus poonsookiae]
EVFSRRFEKELYALRKEFDAQQAQLARYAANPSAHTPGTALVGNPLDGPRERGREEDLPGAAEARKEKRSGSAPGKVAEEAVRAGETKEERKERKEDEANQRGQAVSDELGRVDTPKPTV